MFSKKYHILLLILIIFILVALIISWQNMRITGSSEKGFPLENLQKPSFWNAIGNIMQKIGENKKDKLKDDTHIKQDKDKDKTKDKIKQDNNQIKQDKDKIKQDNKDKKIVVWENKNLYSLEDIVKVVEFIESNIPNFEPLTKGEIMKFKKFKLNGKSVPLGMMTSLRNIIATQNSINAKMELHKYYHQIKNDFTEHKLDEKVDMVKVKKYFSSFPLPPLEIVRFLEENGFKVPVMMRNWAESHDSESKNEYNRILSEADKFENSLVAWFRKNYPAIKFKTQNELIAEQTAKFGKPYATPDILFNEPILFKVNGVDHLIRWLDAKNYTLVSVPFILQSAQKQAEKYLQNYGPGALVFHYGMTKNINIPGAINLDALEIL